MTQRNDGFPGTSADDRIRQGRIVLNTPQRRAVFFGSIAAIGLICLLMALAAAF